ncbi:urease accessory protein UreD [Sphaerisporangium sp. NPDC051017]|uniref:urease accessory protein UreD n=1 Tax=Sphaerisporangium sp. NPDC051017 TaxID=3154636 RepID=UPI003414D76B
MPRPPVPSPTDRRSLDARAAVVTELSGGRTVLRTLRSDPPLTLRQTGPAIGPATGSATVHLVSTAAGPLGGDRLELHIDVAPGTSLELASVASTLVLPGPGESVAIVEARVGVGASLRYAPEPVVLAAGSAHRMIVRLAMDEGASVYWREEIVFGRYGERPGTCHARFDATVRGVPLLRQEFVVGDPAVDGSPAVYGDARCVGSVLVAGPRPPAVKSPPEAVVGEGCAVLPLAGPGTLVSALAPDAPTLRERLAWGESYCDSSRP